ncbi:MULTISPECIES: NAD(P)/FAD-dependent oxidoreductase [Shouchella]|uniref:Ferredoxin--NADP reductase n=2 Tax=Bacillaceae TaxID=186817 RepID=A0A060LW62_9BACI|nr:MULTISPECIES: NAD(P)/FAD-dependent oxidoreductase [Bacillaceae]AIC95486.1 ferredoxin--NADP reductase 2 [Shouchella lehensis G1]KQL55628.1 ferredoxin-NADP reductase [Alkalicoccobacillus plakortidis]MBG9783794.1 ferredoxin-NADP reductase [Shouchella lehensis]
MEEREDLYDLTIIGGGPAGLFAAFYAGMRQMKVKVVESMPQLGGQLSALYPDKYIYDVAGFPNVKAQDLVDQLTAQAQQFNPTLALEEAVQTLVKEQDDTFTLTTNKQSHATKAVLITAGAGAFAPRKLKVADAEQYEDKNIHYFIRDLSAFTGKRVVVIGGGDSAVDWALMLEPIAKEVTLVHRRDEFRAHEHSVELLKKSKVRLLTPFETTALHGNGERVESLTFTKVKGEETETIHVDDVVVTFGFVSSLGPIKEWGLDIHKNAIKVNSKMETTIEGVYAAGDVSTYDGKVKLIATGFGEAPTAVNNAKVYIDPKARVFPGHSTSLFE